MLKTKEDYLSITNLFKSIFEKRYSELVDLLKDLQTSDTSHNIARLSMSLKVPFLNAGLSQDNWRAMGEFCFEFKNGDVYYRLTDKPVTAYF